MSFGLGDEFYNKTWFLFDVIFNGICCTFGVVGNLISLFVLYRLKEHKSTVYLLATLAVMDTLFLLYITISRVIPGACLAAGYPEYHIAIFEGFWISWPLGCIAQTAGTWLIVAITCDRYLAVHFPFRAVTWNIPKKIKRVIFGILLAAVLFHVPKFFDEPQTIIQSEGDNAGLERNTLMQGVYESPEIVTDLASTGTQVTGVTEDTSAMLISLNDTKETTANAFISEDRSTKRNIDKERKERMPRKVRKVKTRSKRQGKILKEPVSEVNTTEERKWEIVAEISSFAVNLPAKEKPVYVIAQKDDYNITPTEEENSSRNVLMQYVYHITLTWLFVYLIPLTVLFVLNILLIRELRKAQLTHAQMTNREEEELNNKAVTLNIIIMVGVFFICQTPDFVHIIISWRDIGLDHRTVWQAFYVSIWLLSLNASVNFLIYCMFYRGFRQALVNMMCRSKGRNEGSSMDSSQRMDRGTSLTSKTATTDV